MAILLSFKGISGLMSTYNEGMTGDKEKRRMSTKLTAMSLPISVVLLCVEPLCCWHLSWCFEEDACTSGQGWQIRCWVCQVS